MLSDGGSSGVEGNRADSAEDVGAGALGKRSLRPDAIGLVLSGELGLEGGVGGGLGVGAGADTVKAEELGLDGPLKSIDQVVDAGGSDDAQGSEAVIDDLAIAEHADRDLAIEVGELRGARESNFPQAAEKVWKISEAPEENFAGQAGPGEGVFENLDQGEFLGRDGGEASAADDVDIDGAGRGARAVRIHVGGETSGESELKEGCADAEGVFGG